MKVKIESSRIIMPVYDGIPPSTKDYIPLSVFDKVAFDAHIAVIYAFRSPTPPNRTLEIGLLKVLSEYREWGGRLGENDNGDPVIFLNDEGVRFVEACVDDKLNQVMPLKPSPTLLSLHPSLKGVKELVQVQLTRFTCGSLVVGFTAHHLVADGHATSNFLVAWGKACRGLGIGPIPLHDRGIFVPRDPPCFEFEHKGAEFTNHAEEEDDSSIDKSCIDDQGVVVHKFHFTIDFLVKLKAQASYDNNNKYYSTFESLVAHLWRAITRARALDAYDNTHIRISVNGRMRLNPRVPNEYFGNLVLWAFPSANVKDLLSKPLAHAAKIIHEEIVKVNNEYFRSFIDYATYKAPKEGLVPTANMSRSFLSPNIEVDSWLRFPFYELDFGGGCPYIFMPSYFPTEGMMFLLPSFIGDGSIDAFIPLFRDKDFYR